ncbi:NAD(P)-binding domain-containing protein, partial [Nocardia tenerifensis]|uniref:NAD(P)-binding domain-containing protein n=1 Tax=Nocardia tenerifensis TaxID=228006 RepID=UPI0014616C73
MTVGIVSAGRVGSALGAALERAGHVVFGVAAISDASVRRARTRLPDSEILPVEDVAARSELLLLAVPDTELAGLARGLASAKVVRPGTIVAHTSGANGVGVLAPLAEVGAMPLAIHPAMTFTGHDEDIARLGNACFGITAADEIGYAIAQALVIE